MFASMTDIYVTYGPMLVLPLLIAIGWTYTRFTGEKFRATKVGSALFRAGVEIKAGVLFAKQTYVDEIRRGREDGTLTVEEREKALEMAMDAIKANYGVAGLAKLAKILGLDSVEGWLMTHVEASLQEGKSLPTLTEISVVEENTANLEPEKKD